MVFWALGLRIFGVGVGLFGAWQLESRFGTGAGERSLKRIDRMGWFARTCVHHFSRFFVSFLGADGDLVELGTGICIGIRMELGLGS